MPTNISDGMIIKATIYCKQVGQVAVNRLMLRAHSKTGLGVTDQDFADAFFGDVAALYKEWMPATAEITGVRAQIIRPVPFNYVRSTGALVLGIAAGTAQSPQTAVDLRLKTANVGKMNRGRQYLPFWDDTFLLAGGFLTPGGQTKAANYGTFLLGPIVYGAGADTQRFEVIIDSKGSTVTIPPTPAHVNVVTSVEVVQSYATQRRRSHINKGDSFGP